MKEFKMGFILGILFIALFTLWCVLPVRDHE